MQIKISLAKQDDTNTLIENTPVEENLKITLANDKEFISAILNINELESAVFRIKGFK